MFNESIETIISNGVATIGENILFQKGLEMLTGIGMMMRYNCIQIN